MCTNFKYIIYAVEFVFTRKEKYQDGKKERFLKKLKNFRFWPLPQTSTPPKISRKHGMTMKLHI